MCCCFNPPHPTSSASMPPLLPSSRSLQQARHPSLARPPTAGRLAQPEHWHNHLFTHERMSLFPNTGVWAYRSVASKMGFMSFPGSPEEMTIRESAREGAALERPEWCLPPSQSLPRCSGSAPPPNGASGTCCFMCPSWWSPYSDQCHKLVWSGEPLHPFFLLLLPKVPESFLMTHHSKQEGSRRKPRQASPPSSSQQQQAALTAPSGAQFIALVQTGQCPLKWMPGAIAPSPPACNCLFAFLSILHSLGHWSTVSVAHSALHPLTPAQYP